MILAFLCQVLVLHAYLGSSLITDFVPPELPFARIITSGSLSQLESRNIQVWDISRVSNDGRHLVALGPSAEEPGDVMAVAWGLEAKSDGGEAFPIVARCSLPLQMASHGMNLTKPDRFSRPSWSVDIVGSRIIFHVESDWATAGGVSVASPPRCVSVVPNVEDISSVERYSNDEQVPAILFNHVARTWEKLWGEEFTTLVPTASLHPTDLHDEPAFSYEWHRIPPTIDLGRGEVAQVCMSRDRNTLLIHVSPARFFTGSGERPTATRLVIWDIANERVRHEYSIAAHDRAIRRHIVSLIGSSPSGQLAAYRTNSQPSVEVTNDAGVFLVRTVAPWDMAYVETPTMVHDIAWLDEERAILILSGRDWATPGEAVDGSNEAGNLPRLFLVDFANAFAP